MRWSYVPIYNSQTLSFLFCCTTVFTFSRADTKRKCYVINCGITSVSISSDSINDDLQNGDELVITGANFGYLKISDIMNCAHPSAPYGLPFTDGNTVPPNLLAWITIVNYMWRRRRPGIEKKTKPTVWKQPFKTRLIMPVFRLNMANHRSFMPFWLELMPFFVKSQGPRK